MDTNNVSLQRYQPKFVTDFEKQFDASSTIIWFRSNSNAALYCIIVYCISIFFLSLYMRNKPRWEVRLSAVTWNFCLAIYSLVTVLRVAPDLFYDAFHYGYEFTLCDSSWVHQSPASALWALIFVPSKVIEFGDTVFIVLRKRQLTYLHVYHHITAALMVFYFVTKQIGPARWVPVVNGGVHTIMYTYFGIRMLGYYVPKKISMMITSIQLLQMFYGIFMIIVIKNIKGQGRECDLDFEDANIIGLLVISYCVLFINFFYQTYIKKPKLKSE